MEFNSGIIWSILGVGFFILEIITLTTYLLALGISALVISSLIYLFGENTISFNFQLLIFAFTSIVSMLVIKKFSKKTKKSHIGQSKGEAEDQIGRIIKLNSETTGRCLFSYPVLGAREWEVVSDELFQLDSQVRVVEVIGNRLKVVKHTLGVSTEFSSSDKLD